MKGTVNKVYFFLVFFVTTISCHSFKIFDNQIPVSIELLRKHVKFLVELPDYRNYENLEQLNMAAAYIKSAFEEIGLATEEQCFTAEGNEYKNIIGKIGEGKGKKIVLGAHYDVCGDQPGADDNASGVACLLEIARIVKAHETALLYEIEFVAYTLEEPPFFGTELMGSFVHAKSLREKNEAIDLMIALEMVGYFSEKKDSQKFPLPLLGLWYPNEGNFIAAVSNLNFGSIRSIRKFKQVFTATTNLPCEVLAAPSFIPGLDFSDHRNYWQLGYRAMMITDTAFYRNRNYHEKSDTSETLDFSRMKEVAQGTANFLLSNPL